MSNELLERIIEAYGGMDRWNRYDTVDATVVAGGGFFPLKGLSSDSTPRRVINRLHEERSVTFPFGAPDQRMLFSTEKLVVEKLDGTLIADRRAPKDAFAGHQMSTPWDPLHFAYFNGEALWTYFTTPFLLTLDGVEVEETESWREGSETWRVLRAYFPGTIETHSIVQDFFFGEDLMLRRHDYDVNVAGGFGASQLISHHVEAGGIHLPTRRLAYTRGPDRKPIRDMLMVSMDISNVTFS